MSKYDQYIKEYLLKNSELSIEKIGVFTLSPLGAGERSIQPQALSFQFDKRAQTSEGLIEYISAQTAKNKILISSDLSSIFEDARQYANIGKAFSFAGLGNVTINRAGEYEFVAGAGNVPMATAENSHLVRAENEVTGKSQAGKNVVIMIAFLIVVLVAGGLGWGIYKYLKQRKSEPVTTETQPVTGDTTKAVNPSADTTAHTAVNSTGGDSAQYKFIFETTYNPARAYKRYDSLRAWKEKCLLDSAKRDSGMVYHLYVTMKVAPKDTTIVRDSIQKYYDRPKVVIQRM